MTTSKGFYDHNYSSLQHTEGQAAGNVELKVRSGFKGDDFKRRLAPVVVAQTAGYSGTRRLADGQSVSLAYLSNCWQQCSMHKNT